MSFVYKRLIVWCWKAFSLATDLKKAGFLAVCFYGTRKLFNLVTYQLPLLQFARLAECAGGSLSSWCQSYTSQVL